MNRFGIDRSYHFATNDNKYEDMRLTHENEHYAKAVVHCMYGKPLKAAKEFETGLHPKQGIYVHGHHNIEFEESQIVVQNQGSPQTNFGDPANYPDDPDLNAIGDPLGIPYVYTFTLVNGSFKYPKYEKIGRNTSGSRHNETKSDTIAAGSLVWKYCACRKYFFGK